MSFVKGFCKTRNILILFYERQYNYLPVAHDTFIIDISYTIQEQQEKISGA